MRVDTIPSKFEFDIGGYMGSSFKIVLTGEHILYTWYGRGYEEQGTDSIEPTARQWKAFRSKLDQADAWNWDESYSSPDTVDGTNWSVSIQWDDQEVDSGGSNGYPPRFKGILSAVRKLIGGREFY